MASYGSYEEAQRAVDRLSDKGFPVERVAIVARDLEFVEQVTGRRGFWQALGSGAGSGAVVGVLFGFVFGLLNVIAPLVSAVVVALYGLVFGAVVGGIVGALSHALSGGRRDFSSVGGMRAGSYDVMADAEVAGEARRLLGE
ncbi:general stress protein [Rubrobacter xylanophilus]|uniref:general stress protein n=1 Tax=Rubrobacter xylanophilus TaxID=49319 RepID=UPI00003A25A0|nr:general stress protein [Rubrobacter xylanophilus]